MTTILDTSTLAPMEQRLARPEKIDIATIVFDGEIHLLRMQARSISRHMAADEINQILILVNDDDASATMARVRDEVLPEYAFSQDLRNKVEIIDARSCFALPAHEDGWIVQQIIKVMIATIVSTPQFLMLDAKNHSVSATRIADLFDEDGRPYTHVSKVYDSQFKKLLAGSYAFFNVSGSRIPEHNPPTITPQVMLRDLMVEMIGDIESTTGKTFADTFIDHAGKWTEFFIYQAYMFAKFGGFNDHYSIAPPNAVTLFTKWPQERAEIEAALERTERANCLFFGLHRARIPNLNRKHAKMVLNIWRDAGLVRDDEDMEWILPMKDRQDPPLPPEPDSQFRLYRRLGLDLLLDKNSVVDHYLITRGYWEKAQIDTLFGWAEAIRSRPQKKLFFDAGSFWGLYSLLARNTKIFDEIILFESDHRNFSQMQAQMFLNRVIIPDEIRPVFSAITREPTQIRMLRSETRKDGNRGAVGVLSEGSDKAFSMVNGTSLDLALARQGEVIVGKIDVEGHELEAIAGAQNTLSQNECLLQIESNDHGETLRAELERLNYRIVGQIGPDYYATNIAEIEPQA